MAASGTLHRGIHAWASSTGCAASPCCCVLWYHVWEISWLPPGRRAAVSAGDRLRRRPRSSFFSSGFVISYPFVAAEHRGKPQPSWATLRLAALHQDRSVVRALDRRCVSRSGYAQRQPGSAPLPDLVTHLLFIHTWFPATYGSDQRRALDASGRSRVLLPLSADLVGLSARAVARRPAR